MASDAWYNSISDKEIAALFDPASNPIRARRAHPTGPVVADGGVSGNGDASALAVSAAARAVAGSVIDDSEEDPSYEAMFTRTRQMMRAHNPDLVPGAKRITLIPPTMEKVGGARSNWTNFGKVVDFLRRDMEHVKDFVLIELATTGSLANMHKSPESLKLAELADAAEAQARAARAALAADAAPSDVEAVEKLEATAAEARARQKQDQHEIELKAQLLMKGKHTQKNVEKVLKKYLQSYVRCGNCRSRDTVINKDPATRLMYLQCNTCHASRTVAALQGGFKIVKRGQRRKERAAAES